VRAYRVHKVQRVGGDAYDDEEFWTDFKFKLELGKIRLTQDAPRSIISLVCLKTAKAALQPALSPEHLELATSANPMTFAIISWLTRATQDAPRLHLLELLTRGAERALLFVVESSMRLSSRAN